jgi:hypothetical protein
MLLLHRTSASCLPVWGNAQVGVSTKMNTVLLRTARIMLNDRHIKLDNSTYMATGISSFNMFLFLCNVCCIFKLIHDNNLHFYTNSILSSDNSTYSTRNATCHKIMLIKHKRTSDKYCFQVNGVKDWNTLPFSITSIRDFKKFKSAVLAHLGLFQSN